MADSLQTQDTLRTLAEAQSKIAEARTTAINAIQERSRLVAKIGELEEKLVASENWEIDKQRYERQAAASGAFFYSLREKQSEPAQTLCAKCFENGRKSVLRQMAEGAKKTAPGDASIYQCSECLVDVVI